MFAFFALLFTVPFYPLIMLAIYLNSPGPLFYGALRQGRGGRNFTCWKFRTMVLDADEIKKRKDVTDLGVPPGLEAGNRKYTVEAARKFELCKAEYNSPAAIVRPTRTTGPTTTSPRPARPTCPSSSPVRRPPA